MYMVRGFAKSRQWLAIHRNTLHLLSRNFAGVDVTRAFLLAPPSDSHAKITWTGYYDTRLCTLRQFASTSSSNNEPSYKTESDEGIIIYRGSLDKQIFMTKFFSLSSSLIGFTLQPYLYSTFGSAHVAVIVALVSSVGFFTYVTPFLLHWVTKRYVSTMSFHREDKVFTVTTFNFFMRPRKMQFVASDVHIPDVPGLFTSMLVKNKPIFFDPKDFQDADAFEHLMGFDKPLDLKLGVPPSKRKLAEDKQI